MRGANNLQTFAGPENKSFQWLTEQSISFLNPEPAGCSYVCRDCGCN